MQIRKARIDRVKYEQAQAELEGATFKPNLSRSMRAIEGRSKIKNLAAYLAEKKLRTQRRLQIIKELEDREFTGSPQINRKSLQIVKRLRQQVMEGTHTSRRQAFLAERAEEKPLHIGPVSTSEVSISDQRHLPGHEEDKFVPDINERSKALRTDGRSVYDRLYDSARKQQIVKSRVMNKYKHRTINSSDAEQDGDSDVGEDDDVARPSEVVLPDSPDYFNIVLYSPRCDFLVQMLEQQERK